MGCGSLTSGSWIHDQWVVDPCGSLTSEPYVLQTFQPPSFLLLQQVPYCGSEPLPPPPAHFSRSPEEEIADLSSPGRAHKHTPEKTPPKKHHRLFSVGSPGEEDENSQDSGVGLEKDTTVSRAKVTTL